MLSGRRKARGIDYTGTQACSGLCAFLRLPSAAQACENPKIAESYIDMVSELCYSYFDVVSIYFSVREG